MIRPRLSLRGMAVLMTGAAVVFAVASQPPAVAGIVVGLVSIPIALMFQAAFFFVGALFGRWLGPVDVVARTSRGGVEHSSPLQSAPRQVASISPSSTREAP